MVVHVAQVVQEYERAVIFRLGRLLPGGAKGPGECCMYLQVFVLVMFDCTDSHIRIWVR